MLAEVFETRTLINSIKNETLHEKFGSLLLIAFLLSPRFSFEWRLEIQLYFTKILRLSGLYLGPCQTPMIGL